MKIRQEGPRGGLIFSTLFVLLKFPVTTVGSASLFLNGIAAISAIGFIAGLLGIGGGVFIVQTFAENSRRQERFQKAHQDLQTGESVSLLYVSGDGKKSGHRQELSLRP